MHTNQGDAHSIAIVPDHIYEVPAYLRAQGFAAKQPPVVWVTGAAAALQDEPEVEEMVEIDPISAVVSSIIVGAIIFAAAFTYRHFN